jgi:hypothetical protein
MIKLLLTGLQLIGLGEQDSMTQYKQHQYTEHQEPEHENN